MTTFSEAWSSPDLVMQQIREQSPILRKMRTAGKIGLARGMYELSTGEVHFFEN